MLNARMLQFASVELAESRDFVIAACGVNASAFPFVSEDLRADHGVILEAVERNPAVLQFIAEDRDIVLQCIERQPGAFRYASEHTPG